MSEQVKDELLKDQERTLEWARVGFIVVLIAGAEPHKHYLHRSGPNAYVRRLHNCPAILQTIAVNMPLPVQVSRDDVCDVSLIVSTIRMPSISVMQ